MIRKVIFTPDDYWTNPPKENHMTDNNGWTYIGTDIIRATPDERGITTMYYPEGTPHDRRLGVAINFTDPKLGEFWVPLIGDDLYKLHALLDRLLKLTPEQLHNVIDQVHTGAQRDKP